MNYATWSIRHILSLGRIVFCDVILSLGHVILSFGKFCREISNFLQQGHVYPMSLGRFVTFCHLVESSFAAVSFCHLVMLFCHLVSFAVKSRTSFNRACLPYVTWSIRHILPLGRIVFCDVILSLGHVILSFGEFCREISNFLQQGHVYPMSFGRFVTFCHLVDLNSGSHHLRR